MLMVLIFLYFFLWVLISKCYLGWHQTPGPLASTSQVQGLEVSDTTSSSLFFSVTIQNIIKVRSHVTLKITLDFLLWCVCGANVVVEFEDSFVNSQKLWKATVVISFGVLPTLSIWNTSIKYVFLSGFLFSLSLVLALFGGGGGAHILKSKSRVYWLIFIILLN